MTYAVIVRWVAKPGEEGEVERCLRALIEPSRNEPGNLAYQPHRDPEDPRVFPIYEHYVDAQRASDRSMGREGLEPSTLGLRVPCSTS